MYRFPGPRAAPGLLSLEFPRLGRDASVQRMYWQLVLPPKEHVVEPPASFSGEFSWGWNGLFWGRKPLLEQRQLERWCGARELADVAGDANRYLFSTLGPVSRCEVRTAMRPLIVMGASGIALVLGLLLIYVPALRHPAVMLVGAVLVGGAAILYPEPALLLGQAASLGVVLTILAGLLQRGVVRHRVIPPQEVSSSIIERSSTQTHYRPPAAGGEPPTETTAAAVPAPASGPQP
jgi:hypothetical protein